MIAARNLGVRYGGWTALEGVDLEIQDREMVALVGPNGAGKSTLMRALAGLTPAQGEVELDGQPLARIPRKELARTLALVPQTTVYAFPYSVEEVVQMGRFPYQSGLGLDQEKHREVVEECLTATGTLELRARRIHELSGGEQQRVRLAQALAQRSRYLLLDEPTAHLDLAFQIEVLRLLQRLNQEQGLTVVVSLHDLNLAAGFCSRIVMLRQGRLVAHGTPQEVLTAERIEAVFGVPVEVLVADDLVRMFPRRAVFRSS